MKIINSKIFKLLVILFIVGAILGLISYFIFDTNNLQNILKEYINSFTNLKYKNIFILSLNECIKNELFIFLSGILLLSIIVCPLLIFIKGISISMVIVTLIVKFKLKGILIGILLLIPFFIINLLSYLILSYYSMNITIKLYDIIKNNRLINIKTFFKKYLLVFIILTIILLINIFFNTFISSNLIKFVI